MGGGNKRRREGETEAADAEVERVEIKDPRVRAAMRRAEEAEARKRAAEEAAVKEAAEKEAAEKAAREAEERSQPKSRHGSPDAPVDPKFADRLTLIIDGWQQYQDPAWPREPDKRDMTAITADYTQRIEKVVARYSSVSCGLSPPYFHSDEQLFCSAEDALRLVDTFDDQKIRMVFDLSTGGCKDLEGKLKDTKIKYLAKQVHGLTPSQTTAVISELCPIINELSNRRQRILLCCDDGLNIAPLLLIAFLFLYRAETITDAARLLALACSKPILTDKETVGKFISLATLMDRLEAPPYPHEPGPLIRLNKSS